MNRKRMGLAYWVLSAWVGLLCIPAGAVLPTNFPAITVATNVPGLVGDGAIFLAVASETPGVGYYLMILDDTGAPIGGTAFKELPDDYAYDFKLQPNGLLSYAQIIHHHSYVGGGDAVMEILDENLAPVETVVPGNGYLAEAHDFQILPNGNLLLFGYYMTEVDMSQYVSGGYPAALVSGGVVQELDAERNVVWQWRSWDHENFEDYAWNVPRSRGTEVSAHHLNVVGLDIDGHLILGTPREVKKINRQTGEILWTLGGDKNDFLPVGAGADVSHFGGHATYRLPDGNFLMYDNGNRPGTVSSKVHEYTLDETNRTATLVWSWEPGSVIGAWHRGNAQRLPNGNTLIGWGGASGDPIPACTEVTPAGDVVFELFFDPADPRVESYRAFRFPFPPSAQGIEAVQYEVARGSDYDFTNETENTGVNIDIAAISGDGYNELSVKREPYAPLFPAFPGKAPQVLPVRVEVDGYGITSLSGTVSFAVSSFGFTHPSNLTVRFRATPGSGLFAPRATVYNHITGEIRAPITQFGEYIFSHPELADVPYPPLLNEVESDRGVQTQMVIAARLAETGRVYEVNQARPTRLSWSPRGFARWYELEVSTDPAFASTVIDVAYQTDAYYVWSGAAPETTYHYRVKTHNEGGAAAWSTGSFRTVPPAIVVAGPDGGDVLTRGIETFIRWDDNLADPVRIDLYKGGVFLQTIAASATSGAYEWEVDLGLVPGNDYTIRITSTVDGGLFGESSAAFYVEQPEIGMVTLQGGSFVFEWTGFDGGMYGDFRTSLLTGDWQQVEGPISGSIWTGTPPVLVPVGFYRLRSE